MEQCRRSGPEERAVYPARCSRSTSIALLDFVALRAKLRQCVTYIQRRGTLLAAVCFDVCQPHFPANVLFLAYIQMTRAASVFNCSASHGTKLGREDAHGTNLTSQAIDVVLSCTRCVAFPYRDSIPRYPCKTSSPTGGHFLMQALTSRIETLGSKYRQLTKVARAPNRQDLEPELWHRRVRWDLAQYERLQRQSRVNGPLGCPPESCLQIVHNCMSTKAIFERVA